MKSIASVPPPLLARFSPPVPPKIRITALEPLQLRNSCQPSIPLQPPPPSGPLRPGQLPWPSGQPPWPANLSNTFTQSKFEGGRVVDGDHLRGQLCATIQPCQQCYMLMLQKLPFSICISMQTLKEDSYSPCRAVLKPQNTNSIRFDRTWCT